jgi:hypothetical protein
MQRDGPWRIMAKNGIVVKSLDCYAMHLRITSDAEKKLYLATLSMDRLWYNSAAEIEHSRRKNE